MKKGAIASIIVSVALTLVLAVSTLITIAGGSLRKDTSVYLAYRTGDVIVEKGNYKEFNISAFDLNNESSPIHYDSEGHLVAASECYVTGSVVKANGKKADLVIEVFTQGTGTSDSPWVIANARHVCELSELVNDSSSAVGNAGFVCEVVSNIDMTGISIAPIGTISSKFMGTINGNGKTISNVNISVTSENYKTYLATRTVGSATVGVLDIGFLGNTEGAIINNLGLTNAKMSVASDVNAKIAADIESGSLEGVDSLRRVTVGGLVGYAYNTIITNTSSAVISAAIRGYAYDSTWSGDESDVITVGVGGVVGTLDESTVSGAKVNANIIVNNAFDESVATYAGGVAGVAIGYGAGILNTISGVNVTLTANTVFDNRTYIGGAVGVGQHLELKDSIVSVSVNGNETFKALSNDANAIKLATQSTKVGGAVASLANNSAVTNVKVNGSIDVKAYVGGVVAINDGAITNAAFSGNLKGYAVGGVVYNNKANGIVSFNTDYNGTIKVNSSRGVRVGGVGVVNSGVIDGAAGENKINVKVYIDSAVDAVEDSKYLEMIDVAGIAGLVVDNNGEIANFNVDATLTDGINIAGLVCNMNSGAMLNNVIADVEILSNNVGNNVSTTFAIAGAVDFVYSNTNISAVTVNISVNENVNENLKYGAAEMGGLVARIYDASGVIITGNSVSGIMFANYSKIDATINGKEYREVVAGGLIGLVAGRGEGTNDAHSAINLNSLTIENNSINNLTINVPYVDQTFTDSAVRKVRSIGSLFGYIGNDSSFTINATNSANNINIRAFITDGAFTQKNGENRVLYIDNGNNNSYGSAANEIIASVFVANLIDAA